MRTIEICVQDEDAIHFYREKLFTLENEVYEISSRENIKAYEWSSDYILTLSHPLYDHHGNGD